MKLFHRFLFLCLPVAASLLHAANPAFDQFVEQFADDWMRASPLQATTAQYFSGADQDALDRKLNFVALDPVERARRVAAAKDGLRDLRKFSVSELSPVQRTSQSVVTWALNDFIRADGVVEQGFVFEQFRGLQVTLVNFLSQTHPVRNSRDVENYLVRLAQVTPLLDQGLAEAKKRAALGVIPPTFILKSTIDGIDRFLEPEVPKNVLVASLDERAEQVEAISPAARAGAVAAAEKLVKDDVIPAFRRIRALLVEQMKVSTDDAGLWRLPRGAEAYAAALSTNTTTNLTPDEVHALGLREVARIEKEMDGFLRQIGYNEGSVKDRYEKLLADSQPPAEPDPRPALLGTFEQIVRDAERRAETAFDLRPKAPLVVKREPAFTEESAAAHYTVPAPDGSRPGVFWAPLPGPTFNSLGMRTLAYH